MNVYRFALSGLLCFCFCPLGAPAPAESRGLLVDERKADLDQLVQSQVFGVSPGLAVGIVQDGSIVYEAYAGYAHLDHRIEIGAQTRFNIASNAKQFTALCVMDLAQKGKLSLSDDLRRHLPEYYRTVDDQITVQQLVGHTSGVRDVYDLIGLHGETWWQIAGLSNSDALGWIARQSELNFQPGSDYLYSNSNYLLLTELVKRTSGQEFAAYARQLFEKAGMPGTDFLTDYMSVVPNRAQPYGFWGSWKQYPSVVELHGDGALFSTLKDQLRWEVIVQQDGDNVFPVDMIARNQSPIRGTHGDTYGFGVMFGRHEGIPCVFHDGQTGAYNATFMRFPSVSLSVVVLANNGQINTNRLAKECVGLLLDDKSGSDPGYLTRPPQPGVRSVPSELIGDYRWDDGAVITIRESAEGLEWQMYDNPRIALVHEEGNVYQFEVNTDVRVCFEPDRFTVYSPSDPPRVHARLPSETLVAEDLAPYLGRFVNTETDTVITVERSGDLGVTARIGESDAKGMLVRRGLLWVSGYEVRTGEGDLDTLFLSGNRLRNVRFQKAR